MRFISLGKRQYYYSSTTLATTLAALLLSSPPKSLVRALSTNNSNRNNMSTPSQKRPNYKAVLFDMDGTLLDTEPLGCQAVYLTMKDLMSSDAKAAFEERQYRMEWPLKQQTLGLPDQQWPPIVLEWATQHWGVPADQLPTVQEFLTTWDHHMFANMHTVGLMPGAAHVVDQLYQAKIPMAIATSSRQAAVQEKRPRHEETIFQKISALVTTDDPAVAKGKPAPDIYLEAARRLGVDDPRACIVVEDGMTGVLAGKAAGCYVVAIPDARSTEEERAQFAQHAHVVLDNLSQWDLAEYFPSVVVQKTEA